MATVKLGRKDSFKVLITSPELYKATLLIGRENGFDFDKGFWPESFDKIPIAVVFWPSADGQRIMKLQTRLRVPTRWQRCYSTVRTVPYSRFLQLVKRRERKKHGARKIPSKPVKCTNLETGEKKSFKSASEALEYLFSIGYTKATRNGIYTAIKSRNPHKFAWGHTWEYA